MPHGSAPRAILLDDATSLVVSSVPAEIYNAEALEPRLADLDWVSLAGAAHHAVIDAIAEGGAAVLPFRLFTLFSSDDAAASGLRERRESLQRTFGRIRGKQEWVLRIGKPDPGRAAPEPARGASRDSGTSFLKAKADARREASARATRVKEDVAAAYEALEQLADETKTRPVDEAGSLLLDAAFLVPPDRVEAIRETLTRRAEGLLRDGCQVSLTGPWPAYSFASIAGNHG
jgi:hypothetical protein